MSKQEQSENKAFDFEAFRKEAMARLKAGDRIGGPDGIMALLMQEFIQESLEGEVEAHLAEGEAGNRRNGKGKKRVRTESGMIDLKPPWDRDGSYQSRSR